MSPKRERKQRRGEQRAERACLRQEERNHWASRMDRWLHAPLGGRPGPSLYRRWPRPMWWPLPFTKGEVVLAGPFVVVAFLMMAAVTATRPAGLALAFGLGGLFASMAWWLWLRDGAYDLRARGEYLIGVSLAAGGLVGLLIGLGGTWR